MLWTCNRLDLETRGSWSTMSKKLRDIDLHLAWQHEKKIQNETRVTTLNRQQRSDFIKGRWVLNGYFSDSPISRRIWNTRLRRLAQDG